MLWNPVALNSREQRRRLRALISTCYIVHLFVEAYDNLVDARIGGPICGSIAEIHAYVSEYNKRSISLEQFISNGNYDIFTMSRRFHIIA